jgi:F-type H+-transporting ATPase subunit a
MRHLKPILLAVLFLATGAVGFAADAGGDEEAAHGDGEHHGLTADAVRIGKIGPFMITNSMVVTVVVSALMIFFAQRATRNVQEVPVGEQNVCEWIVESLYQFLENIVGSDLIKKTFWFFATIFLFILATNWFGLIPGVGTIGWDVQSAAGHSFQPWLRGGNADLNMTFAMATVFFVMWAYWSYKANGVAGMYQHVFGNKGGGTGFMKWGMIVIFFAVGILEVVSILFRPVSLSFRLYGNIFAGENILESMLMIVPWLGWLIPLPFYFLELLVGFVQALVFTLLTAVFTLLMCSHPDEEGHGEEHAAEEAH